MAEEEAVKNGVDHNAFLQGLSPEQQATLQARLNELGPEGLQRFLSQAAQGEPTQPARLPQPARPAARPTPPRLVPIGGVRQPSARDPYTTLDEIGAGFHDLFASRMPVPVYHVSLVATVNGWTVVAVLEQDDEIGREGAADQLGAALREVMREVMARGGEQR